MHCRMFSEIYDHPPQMPVGLTTMHENKKKGFQILPMEEWVAALPLVDNHKGIAFLMTKKEM